MRRPEDLKTTPSNEDFARLMTLAGAYIAAAIDRYKQHTGLQHTASLDDRPLPKRTCASDSPHIPPKPAGKAAHTSTSQAHTSPRARGVSRDVPSMRSRRESARPRPSQLLTRSRPQRWSPKTRHHRRAEDFSYRRPYGSFMDNPAFRPDSEGWKLIDNERIRGNSPPVRSRSGLPELECWKPGGSPTRGSRLSHLRTLVGSVSLQHVCGK